MPKKPKPHGNAQYDWDAIRTLYVTTDVTQEFLCERFGCSIRMVAMKSSDENWQTQRQEYRAQIADIDTAHRKAQVLFDKLQFDAMSERVTDLAVAVVAEKFTAEYKRFKAGNRSEIEALEMREMMAVVKQAQDVKYRALNIAPPTQRIDMRTMIAPVEESELAVEVERAAIEYERIAVSGNKGNGNGNGNGKSG